MNIYLFELKAQWKNALLWTLATILFLAVFQLNIYPIFADSLDDVMDIISGFPKPFLAAFGFDANTMFSFGGFFNLTYNYLALMGTIMATTLSVASFAREKRSKCMDFLHSKPLSRSKIFASKLLELLTLLCLSNALLLLSSVIIYNTSGEAKEGLRTFLLSVAGLFFTQLLFTAFGTAFAVIAKKVRSVSGIATAISFGAFILSALDAIMDENIMHYLAPVKYFSPTTIYSNGKYELQYVCTAILIGIVSIGAAYVVYCKHDIHSV